MEFSFKIEVNATKEIIWGYYSNIAKWYEWEKDLKNITLDGDFSTGISGIMELNGVGSIPFILTHVDEMKEFWDKTTMPFGDLIFGHKIIEENNSIFIEHIVKLENNNNNRKDLIILSQIFSDVPDSVLCLKEVLESN